MKINAHVRTREGVVQVFCPDLPGCSAAAENEEKALRLFRARVADHFAALFRTVVPGTRTIQVEV